MIIVAINMAVAISLAAFILVFLGIVYFALVLRYKADKDDVICKHNDQWVKDICQGSTVTNYIRDIVREEMPKIIEREMAYQKTSSVDMKKLEQIICDAVKEELNAAKEVKNGVQEVNVTRDSRVIESVLYACAVNESDGTFYDVTMIPNSETIYLLKVEKENLASFEVYEKMFDKVKEEQGHLKCGCDVENYTMGVITSMQTNVMGQAARQDDGKWKVTKKANVIFK